jgi:hypothetical protein
MRRATRHVLDLLPALFAASCLFLTSPTAQAASIFADWTAVVIAGDYHASSGAESEAFDNARRDVSAQLARFGFSPAHIVQFSTRPDRYPGQMPRKADLTTIREGMREAGERAKGGCLVYYTSHGVPGGLVLATEGERHITPGTLNQAIDNACPGRPSVVVLSACFSGGFIPGLARNDRMIFTAARSDRTSFGCGESDVYPYFDTCFLKESPSARDFVNLAQRVAGCVAAKEAETGARPPSEPQLWIGPAIKPLLPLYAFPSG